MKELVLPALSLVTAISREGRMIVPNAETELQKGDEMILNCAGGSFEKNPIK